MSQNKKSYKDMLISSMVLVPKVLESDLNKDSWSSVLSNVMSGHVPDCKKCSKSQNNIEYYCEKIKEGNGWKGDVYSWISVCQECKEELRANWYIKLEERSEQLRNRSRSYDIAESLYINYDEAKEDKKDEYECIDTPYGRSSILKFICEGCNFDVGHPFEDELCESCYRNVHPDYDKKGYDELLGYMFSMSGAQCERIEVISELNGRFVNDVANGAFESPEKMLAIAKLIQMTKIIR